MSKFERENRYVVLKVKDVVMLNNVERKALQQIEDSVDDIRTARGKLGFECVVVESDWPEYEFVWAMIQARMEGRYIPPTLLAVRRYQSDLSQLLTPEHDKRMPKQGSTDDYGQKPLHPDINAAYAYVESVKHTSDYPNQVAWHGWALREAFLAGATYGSNTDQILPAGYQFMPEAAEQSFNEWQSTWDISVMSIKDIYSTGFHHGLDANTEKQKAQIQKLLDALKESNEIVALIANHGSPDDEDAESCGTLMQRNYKLIMDVEAANE